MIVLLRRTPRGWRPCLEFPNLPDAEIALGRLAARAAQRGRRAEVVGSLLLIDGCPAFALTITPEWPSSLPAARRERAAAALAP